MPVRNEADYIEQAITAVLEQDYEAPIEVIVADGMSDDGTRDVIDRLRARTRDSDRHVTVLDNPARTTPAALNRALARCRGAVIVRVDGHCVIPRHYVRRCVELLETTGAACVGGTLETVGETTTARAVAAAQSSWFGVGGAAFRVGRSRAGPVDTVAFGAYRREVFERLGQFDEDLVRNQDDEFNFRLRRAGEVIWLDPSVTSRYYSRADLRSLWRQYHDYGLYKVLVMRKHGQVAAARHVVPAAFVASLLVAAGVAVIRQRWAPLVFVAGAHSAVNAASSAAATRRGGGGFGLVFAAHAVLHVAYGVGTLRGVWQWRSYSSPQREPLGTAT